MTQGSLHRVAALVDVGSNLFELSCAIEVFGLHRAELGRDLYDFRLCSAAPTTRMRDGLFTLTGVASLDAIDEADTVIVPNRPDIDAPRDPAILEVIRRAHARGARLISYCSGSFTLAEAGVLDHRRATTHWLVAAQFRSRFPRVHLNIDVLYVDDGDILTAAGSAAALDLGLYVVRQDHGAEVANAVSRRLVFAHRNGGQRQFIDRAIPEIPDNSLALLLTWVHEHLDRPLTVADMAEHAAVSPATLHRRFRAELGTTPLAWLTRERVAFACRLLENGEARLDVVARRSGLGTATNLRTLLRRETGMTPTDYRSRFGRDGRRQPDWDVGASHAGA